MKYIPLLLLLVLTSCASINENETLVKLSVQYAALDYIDQDIQRSTEICSLATDAKSFFDDDALPITQIEDLIRKKWNVNDLPPDRRLIAEALIGEVKARVTKEIDSGVLASDARLTGSKFSSWIQQVSC